MLRWRTLGMLLAVFATGAEAAGRDFDFDTLKLRAQERAAALYSPPPPVDGALAQLDRARWQAMSLKSQVAPWSMAARFVPMPLPPGPDCALAVFNSIQASGIKRFDYRPELFDWAAAGLKAPGPAAQGFCGFELRYPLSTDNARDDFGRFEGGAWQLLGAGQTFGAAALSAAVLGSNGQAESVPFREYWLVRPAAGARQLRVYALAESAALVGAYQFDLFPAAASRAEVRVALYPRPGAGTLLLAPLTGSFVQGEHRPGRTLPLQAEVHEVDGLAIQTASGGRIWRPLNNPPARIGYSFLVNTPRGFGLMQRDREPGHYDPDGPYPRQPGVWVVPGGDWGNGQLRLLEGPATDSGTHNVQVGFVPDPPPAPGAAIELSYTVHWSTAEPPVSVSGLVLATRSGAGNGNSSRRYAVEFAGPTLQNLPAGTVPTAVVDIGRGGRLDYQQVLANPHTGGWRLLFEFDRETDAPLQLRAYLQHADQPLTETWDHVDLPR